MTPMSAAMPPLEYGCVIIETFPMARVISQPMGHSPDDEPRARPRSLLQMTSMNHDGWMPAAMGPNATRGSGPGPSSFSYSSFREDFRVRLDR